MMYSLENAVEQLSNEKNSGCLGFIYGIIPHSYIYGDYNGNHSKDPY